MKNLDIDMDTTLYPPDSDGEVEIEINSYECLTSKYVSFDALEKWVFSIREQIITNATEAQKTGL